jgi:hypothetical protein
MKALEHSSAIMCNKITVKKSGNKEQKGQKLLMMDKIKKPFH